MPNTKSRIPSHRNSTTLSKSAIPTSTAWSSTHNSESEADHDGAQSPVRAPAHSSMSKPKGFRFFDLPSELRYKVFEYVFQDTPGVVDLDPDNFRLIHRKILPLFLTSKRMLDETMHNFYSSRTFRIFPCHPGRFFKTKKPLLARLSARQRATITALELRLGPGFSAPPRGWVITDALGLSDCKNVRVIKVMVQIDPSAAFLAGFRNSNEGFYERFSQGLLYGIIKRISSVQEIQFDAYPGVPRHGGMMTGLLRVASEHREQKDGKVIISWGPERQWKQEVAAEEHNALVDAINGMVIRAASSNNPTHVSVFG